MNRHRVGVLLLRDVQPLDYAIPMHVLSREASVHYDVRTATANGEGVGVAGGTTVVPDGDLRALDDAGTVIVPGYGQATTARLDPPVLAALRDAARRGARMISICSGAFALAQAGLLDGRRATTHWFLCADLAAQYPAVRVDESALYVDDGAVLTSGGVTAGVDLLLHVLRRDVGPHVANHVARRVVMVPRREGEQSQFVEPPELAPDDRAIVSVQQWMLASMDRELSIAAMAAKANLSRRHFHRRFAEATSLPPLEWLHRQRIGRAKYLLETTSLGVDEIAGRVGLGTAANLRRRFKRGTSLSPTRYRELFSQG